MYWSGTWEFANLPLYFGKAGHNDATWTWANVPQMRPEIPKVLNELSIGGTYSINAKTKDPDAVGQVPGLVLRQQEGGTSWASRSSATSPRPSP